MDATTGFQHAKSITLVCRLCFMERKQRELMFEDNSEYLSKWIEKLTSLKITNVPNAPAALCSDCKSTLEAFDSFREMCITNDLVFKETFCRDNFQPVALTDVAVKVEYDEDQQMEVTAAEAVSSLVEDEIISCSEKLDVATSELLINIYEAKFQDVTIRAESDVEDNTEAIAENTVAEDAIKIEYDHHSSIDADVQMTEREKVEDNVQESHSVGVPGSLKYQCKICNLSASRLHILTHRQPELFQCYFCLKAFKRFNLVGQHLFKWHKDKYDELKIEIGDSNVESGQTVIESSGPNNTLSATVTTGCGNSLHDDPVSEVHVQYDFSSYKDGDFECKVCKRTETEMHIKTHAAKGCFQCYICAKKFNRSSKCLNHINRHLRENTPISTGNFCKICMKQASKLHVMSHKAVGLYVCTFCETQFKNVWSLNMHVKHNHVGQNKQSVSSSIGGEPNKQKNNMDSTIDSCVEDVELRLISNEDKVYNQKDLVTCKICNKSVSKLHMKAHKAKALFVCYICTKMFKKYDYLSKHINQHIRKKKNIVPIVKGRNKSVKHEANDNHKESINKPKRNMICIDRDVQANGNNQSPEAIVSNSETSDVIQQPKEILSNSTAPERNNVANRGFECKICNTFVTKLHAESHTAGGFQCAICLSQYNKFDCYSRHVRSHKEQGKYVCKICNKVLSNAYGMSRHEKYIHEKSMHQLCK